MRRNAAWAMFGLAMLLLATSIVMWIYQARLGEATFVPHPFLVPGYGFVGAIIASRTKNAMGWLFLGYALLAAAFSFLVQLAEFLEPRGIQLPSGLGALWPATYLFLGLVLLLFPTGRPANRVWSVIGWATVTTWSYLIATGFLESDPPPVTIYLSNALLIACVTAPIFRRRHASQLLRGQLRWLAYVLGVGLASLAIGGMLSSLFSGAGELGALIALASATIGIPVAVGMAITRNHLYDIDLIIKRTLVYACLTAAVAASYLVAVLALRSLLEPLENGSDLAVVGSTLAVAALFRPLQLNIQRFIDRRFYRERYDAQQSIDAFAAKLRNQFDVGELSDDVRALVGETLHPEHVSLWLRP